jgi:hypothetical protein
MDSSSRGWKDFICREEKRKASWRHAVGPGKQQNLETSGPVGQVGNWVFIAFFYCPRVEMSLMCKQKFPGKEKCLLGQLPSFGTSCRLSFQFLISVIALNCS